MKQWMKDIYIAFKYKIPMDNLIVDKYGIYEILKNPTDRAAKIKYDRSKWGSDILLQDWINTK